MPEDHFLKQGARAPNAEDMAEMRAMAPPDRWARWKSEHGQHCWALHFEPGGCARERTCAFLHAELADKVTDPTWLQEKNM